MSNISIPVIDDKLAEGKIEIFDLMLIVPSSLAPGITAGGRDSAVGIIIDTTGESVYNFLLYNIIRSMYIVYSRLLKYRIKYVGFLIHI